MCYRVMRKSFQTKIDDIFNHIGLGEIKNTNDFISEQQKKDLEEYKEHLEFKEYKEWIEMFEGLTEENIIKAGKVWQ